MRLSLVGMVTVLAACGEPFIPDIPEPPATVVRMVPVAGAVGVARAATVSVTFSEPVRPGTVHGGTLLLYDGPVLVSADVRLADDRRSATLTPRHPLGFGTQYTAVVAGLVMTEAGRLVVGRSWTFETKRNAVR